MNNIAISETDFLQYLTYVLTDLRYIKKNETIKLSSNLNQDLGLDSFEISDIFSLLEDKYHIDLFEIIPGTIHTVKDLYNCVNAAKTHNQKIFAQFTYKQSKQK